MSLSTLWSEFRTWWGSTTIGQEIDAAGAATLAELESIAPADLESVVQTTSTALLTGIAGGNPTAAIISAGISAAEAAFKGVGATVASTTISTFVSTLHNSVATQAPVAATAPALA